MFVLGGLAMASYDGDYIAEQLFYRAMRINRKIIANPEVVPLRMLAAVENDLQKIEQRYPESSIALPAQFALAEFYVAREKYAEAISLLQELVVKDKDDLWTVSKARFLKGAVYQKQGEGEKALREWTVLRGEKYTNTPWGLEAPIYIGNYYYQKGNQPQAERAYSEAALFYRKIESERKGTPAGYTAANLLLRTYIQMRRYDDAGKTAERIVDTYNNRLTLLQQLPNIELLFVRIMRNPDKAIEIYNRIKTKTDEPELRKALEQRIAELTAQKRKRPVPGS